MAAATSTCSKCGAAARDDGTVVGGEDNCKRRVPPVDHNFFSIRAPHAQPQLGIYIYNISYFQYLI